MTKPRLRKLINIELKALPEQGQTIAHLCKDQTTLTDPIDQMSVRDNERVTASKVVMLDHKRRPRALATIFQNSVHTHGVEQEFLGCGIDFHVEFQWRVCSLLTIQHSLQTVFSGEESSHR